MLTRHLPAVTLVFLAPAWVCHSASEQLPSPRTVLAIHWSSEDYPSTPVVDGAIRKELLARAGDAVDYFAEYLESDRFRSTDATLAFRDYVHRKYQGQRIDVVLAITDPALQFVLDHRLELFPDAQIIAATSSAPPVDRAGIGLTGVAWRAADADTLELALTLHPSTERVFVVAQALTGGYMDGLQTALAKFAGRVELTFLSEQSVARLIAAVRAIPARSLILFVRYSQQEPGNVMFPSEVVRLVSDASPVPVYVSTDSHVGTGAVGGVVRLAEAIGTRVGAIARRVLDGTPARDIPLEQIPALPVFDWRQVQRWRIDPSVLPQGSEIRFRTPTAWERYRTAILVTAAVLLLQSLLIAGLVFERKRRRQAEIESRRNLAVMAHLDRRAAMGELATSLAHEVSQPLHAILQTVGLAELMLTEQAPPPSRSELLDIIADIRKDNLRASEVIRGMRGLLHRHELEARPVDFNHLAEETLDIVRPDAREREIRLELELVDDVRPVLGDRVHLQQVLLNLLMNAMDAVATMPSPRRRVRVWTRHADGEMRLAVADAGVGIPPDRVSSIFEPFYTTKTEGSGMGMGLAIARNIVEAHAGRMAAENNADGGATVWFSVPVSHSNGTKEL